MSPLSRVGPEGGDWISFRPGLPAGSAQVCVLLLSHSLGDTSHSRYSLPSKMVSFPSQKRPQPPDFIDPLVNKKPRISHFTQRAQPTVNGKLTMSHGREALLPTPGPLVGMDTHLPPRLEPPRAHDPLADVSNDLGHSGRDCEHREVATSAPASCLSLPLLTDCSQTSRPHGSSSRGKSKKKSKKHKDKERAAGDRHQARPPDLVPGSLGAPPVAPGRCREAGLGWTEQEGAVSSLSTSSTSRQGGCTAPHSPMLVHSVYSASLHAVFSHGVSINARTVSALETPAVLHAPGQHRELGTQV